MRIPCMMPWMSPRREEDLNHLFSLCPFASSDSDRSQYGLHAKLGLYQKATTPTFLYRYHNNHVLDHLEGKKWQDLPAD